MIDCPALSQKKATKNCISRDRVSAGNEFRAVLKAPEAFREEGSVGRGVKPDR
jgi:hypothetical protein